MRSKVAKPVELRNPERSEYEAEIPVQGAVSDH
jgi:hypothetical protein